MIYLYYPYNSVGQLSITISKSEMDEWGRNILICLRVSYGIS